MNNLFRKEKEVASKFIDLVEWRIVAPLLLSMIGHRQYTILGK